MELGRRLGSVDLEAEALQSVGRLLIDQGRPDEGMARMDESMLYATEGRLDPYTTGKVYCSLISACKELGDLDARPNGPRPRRAGPSSTLSPSSRASVACTGPPRSSGAAIWCRPSARRRRPATSWPARTCPTPPRRTPRWARSDVVSATWRAAAAAFDRAEELCGQRCSGVASMRLAQGRVVEAVRIIDAALAAESRRLGRAKLLPVQAQVAIAAGDPTTAESAVDELESIAEEFGAPMLRALALTTRARLQLAAHDATAASATAASALTTWQELDVPYEVATAWTLLGHARRETGDEAGALTAFDTASQLFADLGATATVTAEGEPTTGTGAEGPPASPAGDTADDAAPPAGLTDREVEVLRLVAEGRTNKEIAAGLHVSPKSGVAPPVEHLHEARRLDALGGDRLRLRARLGRRRLSHGPPAPRVVLASSGPVGITVEWPVPGRRS
ncbi:MAG: LuxR C-terminal-related transcriptional regulator [Acidimicrobiia bacterium]|nr:LuxR C-terminal-related transcriptional regulator [Acidimicrobiia bacterium]